MVNENNKPQQSLENEQLGQRLRNSNQALADMQAEHRQLLEEMEQLRKRAEDLQRLREQQEREEGERNLEYQHNIAKATEDLQPDENPKNLAENSEVQNIENDQAADVEEADYIKEKLAEIARLKAQFKRVQLMINTTELIENHISKNEDGEKQLAKKGNNIHAMNKTISTVPTTDITTSDPGIVSMSDMPIIAGLNAATTEDEKEQLMLTMLNMFQDFSSDLKSQADSLRAERERIKELKESIIRSRKEQTK